jgi:hypothetical protein
MEVHFIRHHDCDPPPQAQEETEAGKDCVISARAIIGTRMQEILLLTDTFCI